MNHYQSIIFALFILSTVAQVQVRIGKATINPTSQPELLNYLNIAIGYNHESIELTPQFRTILSEMRLSIFNPVNKIIVLLIVDNNIKSIEGITQIGNSTQKFLSSSKNRIYFSVINTTDEIAINKQIEQHADDKSIMVIIRADQAEIQKLSSMMSSKSIISSKRRLQEKQVHTQTDTSGSYLIKFFFSLLFIIVIIGVVGVLASNDGKKDTLLYAKFIADVSNSR